MFSGIERAGPLTDKQVGPYKVGSMVGLGTFSTVYRAQHVPLRVERALKVLRSDFNNNQDVVNQFAYEARVMAALDHPSIVRVYDIGLGAISQVDLTNYHYMAMEFVDGKPVSEVFSEGKKPATTLALSIIGQFGAALHHAHEREIIHNDLKPSNILVDRNFQVKVTDFGSARNLRWTALNRQHLSATARYSAPELLNGEDPTISTDIYSLGVVSYELLTGKIPSTEAASNRQVLEGVIGQSGIKLNSRYQVELVEAILSQLSPDAKKRPGSIEGFLELLNSDGSVESKVADAAALIVQSPDTSRLDNSSASLVRMLIQRYGVALGLAVGILVGMFISGSPNILEQIKSIKDSRPAIATAIAATPTPLVLPTATRLPLPTETAVPVVATPTEKPTSTAKPAEVPTVPPPTPTPEAPRPRLPGVRDIPPLKPRGMPPSDSERLPTPSPSSLPDSAPRRPLGPLL